MVSFDLIPPLPKRLDLEPTTRCNFHCKICQRTYWDREELDMQFQQFKHIIKQFPDLQQLKIQGMGEPLLNRAFFEMVSYSKSLGIDHVSTYTNGSLLNYGHNAKSLIDSGIDQVRISIDSNVKESFEKLRPGSNFQALISNVKAFTELALHHQHPAVEIWTVVTHENIDQLTGIIDLANELLIRTVHFQTIMNTFDYKDEIQEKLLCFRVRKEELMSKINYAVQYAAEKSIALVIQKSKSHTRKNPCHWPFDSAYITVEGFVVPCCTIADPNIINMGNVLEEPFEKIWVNNRYQNFRESILKNYIPKPCKNCYRS